MTPRNIITTLTPRTPRNSSTPPYQKIRSSQASQNQNQKKKKRRNIFIGLSFLLFVVVVPCLIYILYRFVFKKKKSGGEEKECVSTCVTPTNNTKLLSDPLPSSWPELKMEWMKKKGLDSNQVILQTNGCILQDGRGTPVVLKGISMTGLEWEYPTLVGATDSSFESMKKWGANVVRVPFTRRYIVNSDGSTITDQQKSIIGCLDDIIEKAMKYGMYIILDNHQIGSSTTWWDYYALTALVQRYQNYGMVMFEIYNEQNIDSSYGCKSYFNNISNTNLSIVNIISSLRLSVTTSPILIIPGLDYSSIWTFLNADILNKEGKPFCEEGSVETILSAGKSVHSSSPNIMFAVHPYSLSSIGSPITGCNKCIEISPSSTLQNTKLTYEIVSNAPQNTLAMLYKGTNYYKEIGGNVTNTDLYQGWTNEISVNTFQEVDGCKTLLYNSSDIEKINSAYDFNFGWLISKNIAPVIFTEFGNLECISFITNQQFIKIILDYIHSKNKQKNGSCHYTAWAWIDSYINYQSLLHDCIEFKPLTEQMNKDPIIIPCGPYPSLAQQVFNDLSTSHT